MQDMPLINWRYQLKLSQFQLFPHNSCFNISTPKAENAGILTMSKPVKRNIVNIEGLRQNRERVKASWFSVSKKEKGEITLMEQNQMS